MEDEMPHPPSPSREARSVGDPPGGLVPRAELRCASCGYGISVSELPSSCPMCRQTVWQRRG